MKKTYLILMLAVSSVAGHGQIFGLRAGLTLSNFTGDDREIAQFQNRTGYHAGIFESISLHDNIFLEPAIVYTTKGAKSLQSDSYQVSATSKFVESSKLQAQFDYIDVPVLARYVIDQHLFLQAGPSYSFLINKKLTVTNKQCINGECTGTKADIDELGDFRSADFGVNVGVGFTLKERVLLSGDCQVGLSSLPKDPDETRFRNSAWMFSVSYIFHHKTNEKEQ